MARSVRRPRVAALWLSACLATAAFAAAPSVPDTATFVGKASGVTYDYPASFKLDPEFHGSPVMIGVSDSSMEKGDISFRFLTDPALVPKVDSAADAEQLGAALRAQLDASLRRAQFQRMGSTQLLGRPAADVVYRHILNVASRRPLQLRLVATVIGGKTYSLRCSYPADLAAEYDAVCDAIRDSARLR